jgi:hypothetical protein
MLRAAGIVALIVLVACGQNSPKGVASPSPVLAEGNWSQALIFTGEVSGQMTTIVADSGDQKSLCSGVKARDGQVWSDTFYGTVDSTGQVWGVVFYINKFRGPGSYLDTGAVVEVHNSSDSTQVWQSRLGDKVTFTIDRNQQSGTVEATLTNATSGKPGLQLNGRWNCRG